MVSQVLTTITRRSVPTPGQFVYKLTPPPAGSVTYYPVVVPEDHDYTERDYVTALWAEDWNSPEDAIYDK